METRKQADTQEPLPLDARRSALLHLVRTFFEGSVEKAVASLIDLEERKLSDEDLERISRRIEDARRGEKATKGGRKP